MLNWHPCVYLYQNAVSCLLSWDENVTNQESNNVCCDLILHSIIFRPLAFSGKDIQVYKGAGVTSRVESRKACFILKL